MKSYTSHSLDETREIAKNWLLSIAKKENDEATVVGLSGHLGAGKTAFVKMVAKELGIKEEVTSPTFVIMKKYAINNDQFPISNNQQGRIPWKRLIHIDAYRLERPEELEVLNFEQLVADPANLIMIEWPENVGVGKEEGAEKINFDVKDNKYEINI